MIRPKDLQPNAAVRDLLPNYLVTVVSVQIEIVENENVRLAS